MKHAYLILAHHQFDLLQCLVEALDDARNSIFIHIDLKIDSLPQVVVNRAELSFISDRIAVSWGDVSVVEAEYALLQAAVQQGPFAYYHLLSGVDMPLKSPDEIHTFFLQHNKKEFIGFSQYDYSKEVERKVQRYHLFPKDFRASSGCLAWSKRVCSFLFIKMQEYLGYKRHKNWQFKKGTQWISITHEFASYVLMHRQEVLQMYQHSFCADEIFIQTLCWNSRFKERVYDLQNEANAALRLIQWQNNGLIDWELKDYRVLMESSLLFARKFNSRHIAVVQQILQQIKSVS